MLLWCGSALRLELASNIAQATAHRVSLAAEKSFIGFSKLLSCLDTNNQLLISRRENNRLFSRTPREEIGLQGTPKIQRLEFEA